MVQEIHKINLKTNNNKDLAEKNNYLDRWLIKTAWQMKAKCRL